METTSKAFADWWSTCGFTCEEDEGLASHAFHAGTREGAKIEAQAFNEGYYKGLNELEIAIDRDKFAMAALPCATNVCLAFNPNTGPFDENVLARMAYVMADAMMEARKPK